MKTVQQIYDEYRLMSTLQLHQLRVAGVAKIIADSFNGDIDKDSIVLACLFHDMGNIIKSDLNYFPEFLKPQGLEYWQKVKDEFIEKYGSEEHNATELIVKEFGLHDKAFDAFRHMGFSNATRNEQGDSFVNKICNYSDMRVSPYGVIPMEERIEEGHKRYQGRSHSIASGNFDNLANSMRNMEKQIFSNCSVSPEDITDEKVNSLIPELRQLIL